MLGKLNTLPIPFARGINKCCSKDFDKKLSVSLDLIALIVIALV
jgi:hypothetical protein